MHFCFGQKPIDVENEIMGLLGAFAYGLLIFAFINCILAIISFALMGYVEIALLFLVTLTIPIVMIVHEYLKYRKK